MIKQNMLKVTPLLLVSALVLAGCANKQTWSPALEDAQKTYEQISQDPIVASLAATELSEAQRQLQRAETASAEFRKPHTINHEARLAKIKTLTAQQRARAMSANHSLQLALGTQPVLSEQQILAALPVEEPTMAAALPEADANIVAQIAALTEQLAALNAQVHGTSLLSDSNEGDASLAQIEANNMAGKSSDQLLLEEPALEAALPAPAASKLQPTAPSASQLEQQLLAINAKPSVHGMTLTLGDRYFDQGTARLWSARAARHLDNVAEILSKNSNLILNIDGHTDNTLDADTSYDLSIDRAVSIKSALVLRGIDESRINTQGFGHTQPVAANTDPLGRLQNRRIELIFPNIQL